LDISRQEVIDLIILTVIYLGKIAARGADMSRVKPVKDIALARDSDMSISRLHFAAGISMGAARRYWYGTRDGTEDGEPMTVVDLPTIVKVAKALGVSWKELVEDRLARRVAMAGTVHTAAG
jgi:hypothetical protein